MLMRLAVVAVAVALSAGAWSSGGIGAGIGTVLVTQAPSNVGSPAGSPAVTTTSHPPLPADSSRYWLIPGKSSRSSTGLWATRSRA